MKCLVTGGKGFIGSHLSERLVSDGHDVIIIDDESAPENKQFYVTQGAMSVKADIRDERTAHLYEDVDVVFHLAARSRIQPSIDNPVHTFENNVIGTQVVLEHAVKSGVRRVIYSGSSSIYGSNQIPFSEHKTRTNDSLNHYSLSKKQGEELCALYARMYCGWEAEDLECVTLRYFNVYGPREPLSGRYAPVVGIFKRQRDAGQKLTIVGDGTQRRDFTYIDDVVEANVKAAFEYEHPAGPFWYSTFNIGTGVNYSINELADMVLSGDTEGRIEYLPRRVGESNSTLADITRARDSLEWEPKYYLPEMVNSY